MVHYNSIYIKDLNSSKKDPTPEAQKIIDRLNGGIKELISNMRLPDGIYVTFGEWDVDDLGDEYVCQDCLQTDDGAPCVLHTICADPE